MERRRRSCGLREVDGGLEGVTRTDFVLLLATPLSSLYLQLRPLTSMLPSRTLKFAASRMLKVVSLLFPSFRSRPSSRAHLYPSFALRLFQRSDYGPYIGGGKYMVGEGAP